MVDNNTAAVLRAQLQSKNAGLGLFLALFFGGLGILYASIPIGLIFIVGELVVLVPIAIFTFGIGIILFPIYHVVCGVAALLLIKSHNNKLLSQVIA